MNAGIAGNSCVAGSRVIWHFDNDLENITFDQLRVGIAINLAILHEFAHSGTKFISLADLTEKARNHWIFREWSEVFRI